MAKEEKKTDPSKMQKPKPSYEQLEEQVKQLLILVDGYKAKADQLASKANAIATGQVMARKTAQDVHLELSVHEAECQQKGGKNSFQ